MVKGQLIAAVLFGSAVLAMAATDSGEFRKGESPGAAPLPLTARAVPLNRNDPAAERVGRLRYLGGLVLQSKDKRFGGVSALLWDARCARLLAASDAGYWFAFAPIERDERLVGVADGHVAAFRRIGDAPTERKGQVDAEALAVDASGAVWAFFEQDHRAERFTGLNACEPETLVTVPDKSWQLPETQGWARNGGAEAAATRGDAFAWISESATTVTGARDRRGTVAAPEKPARSFSYAVENGFWPTAMDALNPGGADGRMLVLHRRFAGLGGFSALLSEATIAADGVAVQPVEVARLAPPLTVDNMEALAIRAEGERRFVYLMSDDNYQGFQRTLLLKFELLPPQG